MASKLTDITTSYDTFVPNQVLTDIQLNKFINYFEDQDRLTRICLSGVGIVCGFDVSFDSFSSPLTIVVKQGAGVTTDGDLINLRKAGSEDGLKSIDLREIRYTHFLSFDDENAKYEQFIYNGVQLPLWKLYKSDETASIAPQPLSAFPGNLSDMVVMLYLESYEDKSDLCDGLDCDNQGIHQVFDLHALLIRRTDALQMLRDDEMFDKHELMSTYQQMKDLTMKRVLITPSNTARIADLTNSYALSLEGQTISDLKAGLTLMSNKLNPYYPNNPFPTIITLIDQKLPSATNPPSLFFQYRHDLLRDVVDTYNELKELFVRISTECMPAIQAFPKHLMLGRLSPTEDDILVSRFRHKFYYSPIEKEKQEFRIFGTLVERLRNQLATYPQLPETEVTRGLLRNTIKITPSRYRSALGEKAIPFYNNLTTQLLNCWNFEKTAYGKQKRNLSYNTTLLDSSPAIQTPLAYNLEPYNFLRIEGLHGLDYKAAMAKISDLKNRYGLSFDVKAISIDIDTSIVIDTNNYECEFEDLAVLLKAWVNEQECMLASVSRILSAYSLKKPGYNKKEAIYTPRISPYLQQSANFGIAAAEGNLEMMVLKTNMSDLGTQATPQTATQQVMMSENKAVFGTNSSVLDSLTTDDDTVGYAFMQALNDNVHSSANDLITNGNYYAEQITLLPDALPWTPVQYVSLVDNTLQILAYSHVLSNSIPTSIAGITDEVIANYRKNIDNLCVIVKRVQVQHKTDHTLSDKNSAILQNNMGTLNQLCCASEQLKALLTEIDRRKDEILSRLTLNKFCVEHPGLEHLAGVEPGGTFVMIYLNKGVNVPGGEANTANGIVVADLSLPYMCCSDCSPINFVVPRPAVKLTLPKSIFCIGNDQSPMIFQVEPAGGVIKADKTIPGMTIVGNQLFIDANTFPSAFYNQVINFTVNDQITDCQLTVAKPLGADFAVPQSPASNPIVNFQPVGNYPSGTQFRWDFGDGTSSTQKNTTHTYQLPVNPTNTVTVKLTVTPPNGTCPSTRERDITFQSVSIDIQPREFCANDDNNYEFIITPSGSSVLIEGLGVDPATQSFNPWQLPVGPNPIYMNGVEVFELTINPNPSSIASGVVQDGNVVLNGAVLNASDFYWSFQDTSGQQIHTNVKQLTPTIPLSEFPPMDPGAVFYATLWAENDCNTTGYRVILTVPANTQSCTLDAQNDIKKYYDQINQFMGGGVYTKLTEQQKQLFIGTMNFLTPVSQSPQTWIAGAHNDDMFDALAPLIINTQKTILSMASDPETPATHLRALIDLYQVLVELFLAIIQCQDDQNYQVPPISSLFNLIYSHLDRASEESFPLHDVVIDPDGNFAAAVLNARNFRSNGTGSWGKINDIYYYLQGGTGGGNPFAAGGPVAPSEFTMAEGKSSNVTVAEAPAAATSPQTTTPPQTTTKKPATKKTTTKKK